MAANVLKSIQFVFKASHDWPYELDFIFQIGTKNQTRREGDNYIPYHLCMVYLPMFF